jgi:hypothetical protein
MSQTPHRRILSKAARNLIDEAHRAGKYDDRMNRTEPPYMAPSSDPLVYSSVCLLTGFPILRGSPLPSGALCVMT